MGTEIKSCMLFISLSFIFSAALATNDPQHGDMDWWCDTTPHPDPCKFFMNDRPAPTAKSDFRMMTVEVATERAVRAQWHLLQSASIVENDLQKAAWTDCLRLHDYTVFHLNRTLQGLQGSSHPNSSGCTDFDAQTWLSTALTYLQTCRTGALELNVTDFIVPLLSNNVSELISNSLAINGGLLEEDGNSSTTTEEFPSWVSAPERRLLRSSSVAETANAVVAKDGSGKYRSIQAAINAAAKRKGSGKFVIYVKKGVYQEYIRVGKNVDDIMLIGEGIGKTIITGNKNSREGLTTYNTATVGIDGLRFMARGITFRNTAGPQNGQAVALRSGSDLSVFYRCAFVGYQDTLFAHSQRQFYRECYLYGTIDIIFGNAAVVFQNCNIYARRPVNGQGNTITAQGREDPNQNTGISIHRSQIRATPDLQRALGSFKTYLGRPWQEYSRTVVLGSYIGSLVDPAGWVAWDNTNFAQKTLYYGEYRNFGPSSSTSGRVKWPGFHAITNAKVASQFTVGSFIAGQSWLPATGVPFLSGL